MFGGGGVVLFCSEIYLGMYFGFVRVFGLKV